jgi:F0F1-type ATP synthase assembly protein I
MAEDKNKIWWQKGLAMFARLSVWIAVPVVIGAFLGKWLDEKFQTAPWLFLTTIGLAFFLSMFGLVKETAKEFKNIDKQDKDNNGQ